jgi:hypothetical protein
MPPALPDYAPLQDGSNNVMAILKHVRLNDKILPDDAFDRVPSAINERLQVLDYDSGKGPKHGR